MNVIERPILFSAPMVRAILEGRKTQTRRVISPQPVGQPGNWVWKNSVFNDTDQSAPHFFMRHVNSDCPYGKPGHRLWVRETFNVGWLDYGKVLYRADGGSAKKAGYPSEPKWSPAIHMPRLASRILLEITNVRVERVQDISEEDAKAEGAPKICDHCGNTDNHEAHWVCEKDYEPTVSHRVGFQRLWNSINAKRGYGWDDNPWVWVIEFPRVQA